MKEEQEEKVLCPLCGGKVEKGNVKETYISSYNQQEYQRYECPVCDLHWWDPLQIIPEFYEWEEAEMYMAYQEGMRLRLQENHKLFFQSLPKGMGGRFLDVGCGDGICLKYAQEMGFEVWGIDLNPKSIETAKKQLHMDTLYAQSLEEFCHFAQQRGIKFDVITFFEVLEHQDQPRRFLDCIQKLLKKGGYMGGSVPNRESRFIDMYRKNTFIDFPPHHFLRFSKSCLEKTLLDLGFQEVKVEETHMSFSGLFAYMERRFLGNWEGLKTRLKGRALKNPKLATSIAVEDLEKMGASKTYSYILKGAKYFKNLLLLPLALVYIGKRKGQGVNLVFRGKL